MRADSTFATQDSGCEALGHLADGSERNPRIVAAGGVEAVVNTLRIHGAQDRAFFLLAHLGTRNSVDMIRLRIEEAGGLDLVFAMLEEYKRKNVNSSKRLTNFLGGLRKSVGMRGMVQPAVESLPVGSLADPRATSRGQTDAVAAEPSVQPTLAACYKELQKRPPDASADTQAVSRGQTDAVA